MDETVNGPVALRRRADGVVELMVEGDVLELLRVDRTGESDARNVAPCRVVCVSGRSFAGEVADEFWQAMEPRFRGFDLTAAAEV